MSNPIIKPIQITLHHNLDKPEPVDLTSDIFVFENKPETSLQKYPYVCTNQKLNKNAIEKLFHYRRVEVFFNFQYFKSYLQNTDRDKLQNTDHDISQEEILKYNIDVMLQLLLPMSLPVPKKIQYVSENGSSIGIFDAVTTVFKPVISINPTNENTIIKLHGVTCTIDGVTVLDTLDKNPTYFNALIKCTDYINLNLPEAIKTWQAKYVTKIANNEIKTIVNTIAQTIIQNTGKNLNLKNLQKAIGDYRKEYNYDADIYKTRENNNKQITSDDKKILGIGYMLLTILTAPEKNNIAENEYGLSSINFSKEKEFNFRKSTEIIQTMQQYYYPVRQSTNSKISELFNRETGIIDMIQLYAYFNNISIKNNDKLKDESKEKAFIDNINMDKSDASTPKYNINVQISIVEGDILPAIQKELECKYANEEIGGLIFKEQRGLPKRQKIDLKNDVKKIQEDKKNQENKNKQKNNKNQTKNEQQQQQQQQVQFQQPQQIDNSNYGIFNQMVQNQEKNKQPSNNQEIISNLPRYFNNVKQEIKKNISEEQFINYLKSDKRKDILNFFEKVAEYKNKNPNDINQNEKKQYSLSYKKLYDSTISSIEDLIRNFTTEINDNKQLPEDDRDKYLRYITINEILKNILETINKTEMQPFYKKTGGKQNNKNNKKSRKLIKKKRRHYTRRKNNH